MFKDSPEGYTDVEGIDRKGDETMKKLVEFKDSAPRRAKDELVRWKIVLNV